MGYFALYLSGKMHLFDHRGYTVKAWVAIAPLIGATLIAVSRTMGESLALSLSLATHAARDVYEED